MRTEQARPVRLSDYRPPDWLVDTVELDVSLDPTATKVRATLALRPNPQSARARPCGARRRWARRSSRSSSTACAMPAGSYEATPDQLTIAQAARRSLHARDRDRGRPVGQHAIDGALPLQRHLLHAMRGRGLSPHHLFPDRPDVMAVYTTRIEADKSESARCCSATAISSSAGDVPGTTRHFAVWHDPFPKPSYLFALVGGNLASISDTFTTMSGRTVALHIYVEPGKEDRCAPGPWTRCKRSMRWDEEAFGREYDLDIFMIVAVSDFNMGAMENKGLNVFNDKIRAGLRRHRDRRRLCRHRGGHRARVLPQLDRQPHHLPRLVPALPEGRPHRLPRSGIHLRPAFAPGQAHLRRARPARQQFVEDAGPLAHPVRPSRIARSTTSTRRPSTRRARRSCACSRRCSGQAGFRKGMDLYFDAPRRRGRHRRTSSSSASRTRTGTDLTQFMRWYSQSGTPEIVVSAQLRRQRADLPARYLAQSVPPTPGQPVEGADGDPARGPGLVGANGRDMSLSLEGWAAGGARRAHR